MYTMNLNQLMASAANKTWHFPSIFQICSFSNELYIVSAEIRLRKLGFLGHSPYEKMAKIRPRFRLNKSNFNFTAAAAPPINDYVTAHKNRAVAIFIFHCTDSNVNQIN